MSLHSLNLSLMLFNYLSYNLGRMHARVFALEENIKGMYFKQSKE